MYGVLSPARLQVLRRRAGGSSDCHCASSIIDKSEGAVGGHAVHPRVGIIVMAEGQCGLGGLVDDTVLIGGTPADVRIVTVLKLQLRGSDGDGCNAHVNVAAVVDFHIAIVFGQEVLRIGLRIDVDGGYGIAVQVGGIGNLQRIAVAHHAFLRAIAGNAHLHALHDGYAQPRLWQRGVDVVVIGCLALITNGLHHHAAVGECEGASGIGDVL